MKFYKFWKKLQENREAWQDTSWAGPQGNVTIKQLLDYLGNKTVDLGVEQLQSQLPSLDLEAERIKTADLNYPIIVVKKNGKFMYVLDGNHRLQKAINLKQPTIKAIILDLDNPNLPSEWYDLFS
jgi:hypothetical protein